jgi:hypothetical protein
MKNDLSTKLLANENIHIMKANGIDFESLKDKFMIFRC